MVVTCGERAVCHAIDPRLPAGELARVLALYLGPAAPPPLSLVWRSDDGPRALDPALPIGHQVPPDAEIDFQAPEPPVEQAPGQIPAPAPRFSRIGVAGGSTGSRAEPPAKGVR